MSTAKQFQYLTQLGYTGTLADKQNAYYTDLIANGGNPDIPTAGGFVPDRELWSVATAGPVVSGAMPLAYFTANRTETITSVTTYSGTTAAGATPTLCRVGVYSVDSSGNLTLVASIANDTTLWASTNTAYLRTFSTPWAKTVGQRYAVGVLVVSGATVPTLVGTSGTSLNMIGTALLVSPTLSARITAQTDLPASIAVGSLVVWNIRTGFYFS